MTGKLFKDYKREGSLWITSQERPFYPDYLADAVALYSEVFDRFSALCVDVPDAVGLLHRIHDEEGPIRIQLLRLFRKFVSPMTSVEMLKPVSRVDAVISNFGATFRDIATVRARLIERPVPDEALAAVLWEHHDRGTPGYVLTAHFFDGFEQRFGGEYLIMGPREAGRDVALQSILPKFHKQVPADFVILRKADHTPVVIGFAHYDSDRGGSQEDDRTGGNQDKVEKIMEYAARRRVPLQVLFVNDGPGLLLGSMWDDYGRLETDNVVDDELRVMVITQKMVSERLSTEWLEGRYD
jgi:hypothetical protein